MRQAILTGDHEHCHHISARRIKLDEIYLIWASLYNACEMTFDCHPCARQILNPQQDLTSADGDSVVTPVDVVGDMLATYDDLHDVMRNSRYFSPAERVLAPPVQNPTRWH